jgi:hypothetical protein
MAIKARPNLQPLCDRHRTRMIPVVLEDVKKGSAFHVDGCNAPGCVRHYEPDEGYFDVVDKKSLVGQSKDAPACKEHEKFLYLDSCEPQEKEAIWRCPVDGCSTEQQIIR